MINNRRAVEQMVMSASSMPSMRLKWLLLMIVVLASVFCIVNVLLGQSFPEGDIDAGPDDGLLLDVDSKSDPEAIALQTMKKTIKSLSGKGVSVCVQRCLSAAGPPCVEAGRGLADTASAEREGRGGYPLLWQKVRSKADLDGEVFKEQPPYSGGEAGEDGESERIGRGESDGNARGGLAPSVSAEHEGRGGGRGEGEGEGGTGKESHFRSLIDKVKRLLPHRDVREDQYYKLGRDDVDLLEMAVKRANYMPRVALLFLTDGPIQLAPVWENYLHGYEDYYSLYVHRLPRFESPENEFGPFGGRLIRSEKGRMDLVDAQRRLLANAIMNPMNHRFIILSDSCVPVTDFLFMYHYLMDTADSFVETSEVAERYDGKFLPIVRQRDFQLGSQWVALTRKHATLIVKDRAYYPAFARNCEGLPEEHVGFCLPGFSQWCKRRVKVYCSPDEHYIQTVIHSLVSNELNRRSLMWSHWEGPSRTDPVSWNAGRMRTNSSLLESIRAQKNCLWNGQERECFLFALKFTSDAIPLILERGQRLGLWK
ncbi:hypothetical protein CBR_g39817 [Chara braunii]|uniref:Uncharacterized protein n=1 Tax=Chara braunii TaxID=69332 RepID=A0A388LSK5_CHABU|nr:hypothetical protein CBR_g39817 [Chara braunii]|eukprot:GBG85251.1 hypothetical protein CBR_g39817 [Chara braunii]